MARGFLHPRAAGRFKDRFLRERAAVFVGSTWTTPAMDPVTGLPLDAVPCALIPISDRQPGVTSDERAELAATRVLRFDPDVSIPENARVAVAGHLNPITGQTARWNVKRGTFVTERAPDTTALYKRCDVVRAT